MSLPPPAPESIALVTRPSSGIGEQFARQPSERKLPGWIIMPVSKRLARR